MRILHGHVVGIMCLKYLVDMLKIQIPLYLHCVFEGDIAK